MSLDCEHLMKFDQGDFHIDIVDDIEKKIAVEKVVEESALEVAERVAAIARSTAPQQSGDYAAGIIAEEFRGGARVFASDHKSEWIEFGSVKRGRAARWILRNAAEAAGLTFRKTKG